jgi:hypothetical protein
MHLTRTFQGLEVVLKATGYGRFGGAAFLLVWLAFWVVGEVLVGGLLIWGSWCLLTGQPPGEGRAPLETAPALGVGVFMLFWFAFWTLGGVLAGRELLRLLAGRDRLVLRPDALMVERGFGVFRSGQEIPREQVRRFQRRAHGNILFADTIRGGIELTRYGTAAEFEELAAVLNADWKLSPDAPSGGVLPTGWSETPAPEGDAILIKDPAVRRKQAAVAWFVFLVLVGVGGYILHASLTQFSLLALGAMVAAGAGFAGWGAYQLTYCRDEWLLGDGCLRLQRRIRGRAEVRFEAVALRLREEKDSDGDPWYKLVAVSAAASPALSLREARRHERVIMSAAGDPCDVRNLGRWLAERCRLVLEDGTTAEAKAQEMAQLRAQLAASGRFGRWVARRLGGATAEQR